jgi:hypothetical protein
MPLQQCSFISSITGNGVETFGAYNIISRCPFPIFYTIASYCMTVFYSPRT